MLAWRRRAFVAVNATRDAFKSRDAIATESVDVIDAGGATLTRVRLTLVDVRFAQDSVKTGDALARERVDVIQARSVVETRCGKTLVHVQGAVRS